MIPLGFFLVGVATGALLRTWWSLAYIFVLGAGITAVSLLQEEYPGSESHAIAVAFLMIIVPIVVLGAALGVLIGRLLEREWPGSPAH